LKEALNNMPDEMNHTQFISKLIEGEYLRLWDKNRRLPSVMDISENLGIPIGTIGQYLSQIRQRIFADRCPEYRLLSRKVIEAQANKAIEDGDTPAAKLFMQVTKELDVTPDVNVNLIEPVIIRNETGEEIETLGSDVSSDEEQGLEIE
jgi:hypothetical protein